MQIAKEKGKDYRRKAQSRFGIKSCTKCLRKTLIILMCLVLIMGIVLIIAGAVVYQTLISISPLAITSIQTLPIGLLIIGILTFLTTTLGFCGACMKSDVFLILNFVILAVLLICELAVGGVAYQYSVGVQDKLREQWKGASDQVRCEIEMDFICCGFCNSTDMAWNCTFICEQNNIQNPPPCGPKVASDWTFSLASIGIVGVIVGISQFLVLLVSLFMFICLCFEDDDSEDQVRMTERESTDRSRFDRDRVLNKFKPQWCNLL